MIESYFNKILTRQVLVEKELKISRFYNSTKQRCKNTPNVFIEKIDSTKIFAMSKTEHKELATCFLLIMFDKEKVIPSFYEKIVEEIHDRMVREQRRLENGASLEKIQIVEGVSTIDNIGEFEDCYVLDIRTYFKYSDLLFGFVGGGIMNEIKHWAIKQEYDCYKILGRNI